MEYDKNIITAKKSQKIDLSVLQYLSVTES